MTADLPRLAVITDVPVERTQSGQLLLYRLLQHYPADRLLIVGSNHYPTAGTEYRLADVEYRSVPYSFPRFHRTRLNPLGPWLKARAMCRVQPSVERAVDGFDPEAVLTVTHSHLWLNAARLAARRRLPLHLILHDDWPSMATANRASALWRVVRGLVQRPFGRVYRQAASRLCVSPGMAELYEQQYGVSGEVLYPNRGGDSPAAEVRVGRTGSTSGPVVAFAGALHTGGVHDLLRRLAEVLAGVNGHLDFYTRTTTNELAAIGLRPPVVRRVGFFPAAEMAERVAATAHALFLPASFRANERTDTSTLFPSKLADYTAIGLPLLIWGPEYSSAVRWGRDNPATGVTVTGFDDGRVRDAVVRFWQDDEFARGCAAAACAAGDRDFAAAAARRRLYAALALHATTPAGVAT